METELEKDLQPYNYEWKTAEDIIANRDTKRYFRGWGDYNTLNLIADNPTEEDCRNAHELWLKLKDAFNAEAENYVEEDFHPFYRQSRLGSIGPKNRREVMRSMWWDCLEAGKTYGEDKYDTYRKLIEALHCGEQLETGIIIFGS